MKNELVIKHNDLIEAKYTLSLIEQKVILFAITKIDTSKEKFNRVRFNVSELADLIGSESSRYSEFRVIANSLMDKKIYLKDRPTLEIRWASRSEYLGNGVIELGFDEELIPYLLQLKSRFTRYQIRNILYLENKHSIRIYELLKQYEPIGKRTFTIDKLKEILMLENQYNRFYDFERYVLKPTMEEINDYTDLKVSYEKIKKGRSIHSIKYKIELKEIDDYKTYLEDNYNIKDIKTGAGLQDENFNSKQVIALYEIACNKMGADYETEIDILSYININYKAMLEKDNILNRYAYLMDMLEHDRAKAIVYIRECKKRKVIDTVYRDMR